MSAYTDGASDDDVVLAISNEMFSCENRDMQKEYGANTVIGSRNKTKCLTCNAMRQSPMEFWREQLTTIVESGVT
jgi:hypothetical protein